MGSNEQEQELNKGLGEWAGFKVERFYEGGYFYCKYSDGTKDTLPGFTQSLDDCASIYPLPGYREAN